MNTPTSSGQKEFVNEFLRAHRSLFAYIVALVPNLTDAEEVYQKTSLILWKKWPEYDPSRKFLPWACGIARIQVRRHLARDGRMREVLSDEASLAVAEAAERASYLADARLEALQNCLQRLSHGQQQLVKRCYGERSGNTLQQIAAEMNIAASALYQRLKRVREMLQECIDRSLTVEEQGT